MFAETEVANRTVIVPNVRVSEPVEPAAAAGGQPAAMEANTGGQGDVRGNTTGGQTSTRKLVRNPVVRAGGAVPMPDVQPMCRWIKRPQQLLQTMLKAVLVIRGALLDIKLSKQTRCCQLRQ